MPLFALDNELTFPPPHLAEPDGLLAIGGDLSPERLLLAYRNGIFPWYEGDHILWWSPDPRFVLFPGELRINRATAKLIDSNEFSFTINKDFPQVIHHCKEIKRPGQEGTWITDEVERAYIKLHEMGYAHSAEVWKNDQMAGGLYGVRLGKIFFGESMFSKITRASRVAFALYVRFLQKEGVQLIDCQVYTQYLEMMGAKMITGETFRNLLEKYI